MCSPLGIAGKCIMAFLDFIHVVEAVNDYSASDGSMLQTANIVNRLMLLGFSATETKRIIKNPNNYQALTCLKAKELPSRCLTLLIQLLKGPIRAENDVETELRFLERAVIVPLADIVRVSAEQSSYEIRHCLNNSLEQQHPLSSSIEDSLKPLACRKKLKELESRISSAFKIKVMAEATLISSVVSLYKELYNNIYARAIADLRVNPQELGPEEIEEGIMNAFPILPAFHEDLLFRSYICPITLAPIRYPVEDPTTRNRQQPGQAPTVYERSAIMHSLACNPMSPLTESH